MVLPNQNAQKSQVKPAQNHEIDSFRCFIQQLLNRKKMLKDFKDLGFNTSQMILKSPSQLCQHLGRFFSLALWMKDWVRNVNKVWQCRWSKTFASLDLCASIQSHVCYITLPPHCFFGQRSVAGDTTGAQNSRRNAQARWQLHVLRDKNGGDDAIYGGCCALHRKVWRAAAQRLVSWEGIHLDLPTTNNTELSEFCLGKATLMVQNIPWQLHTQTKAHRTWVCHCLI